MAAVHALAQLIEDVRQMSDPPLSVREVARRCNLSPSWMHQLTHQPMKAMPDPDTMRRLSEGLRIPLRTLVDAALTSLGLPHGEPAAGANEWAQIRRIVENSIILTPAEREYWLTMADAVEARAKARGVS